MVYAQIKNGKVVNTIVLNDPNLVTTFGQGFDFFIQIDQLSPKPGVGWSYDGTNWTPSTPQKPTS